VAVVTKRYWKEVQDGLKKVTYWDTERREAREIKRKEAIK
jgi:hypothetical protein